MDSDNLSAGDNILPLSMRSVKSKEDDCIDADNVENKIAEVKELQTEITPLTIGYSENSLKERITKCKNIVESLKLELIEEKQKLEGSKLLCNSYHEPYDAKYNIPHLSSFSINPMEEAELSARMYSAVDCKLNCDENLLEYEKQLQRYQKTLNMAQIEKKNAIRKQMLAKAYKLKLMEVENQCNIELLRIKQSLQSLEPLRLFASKWKSACDDIYDTNNFELIPRYPELRSLSGSDLQSVGDFENNTITTPVENAKIEIDNASI